MTTDLNGVTFADADRRSRRLWCARHERRGCALAERGVEADEAVALRKSGDGG